MGELGWLLGVAWLVILTFLFFVGKGVTRRSRAKNVRNQAGQRDKGGTVQTVSREILLRGAESSPFLVETLYGS